MGFWSDLVIRGGRSHEVPAQRSDWDALFGKTGAGAGIPLGTAQWMPPGEVVERFGYRGSLSGGRVWIGQGFDDATTALGYEDDRHVCLVSGSRGGKGVGVIVPNLCFWPGSAIVVDPKGENATVTARRRGGGSDYARGNGQKVCILDPFGEVQLPDALKAHYNPLDAIDPESDFAIDDAGRVAAALVVLQDRSDPYWEEAARNLIKGLILHVLSARYLADRRNLVTVRRLLTQGDWVTVEKTRNAASGDDVGEVSAFQTLWSRMRRNPAFNGVVAGVGEQMIAMADKQRSGVLEAARINTEFLDSIPMRRLLETSDFDLAELKTNPQGLTVYLTLPQRFMETHYRWLRLMIVLAVGEMERIKGRPASGHPTLFLLDEFAGLKRMEVVENAAAQAAGFGIKFLFVVQNLAQLAEIYEKSWETFFGNSGLKLFFQIDDEFTRTYLSRQIGELETKRQTRSGSESSSVSRSETDGMSVSDSLGTSVTRSPWLGLARSRQQSRSRSRQRSRGSSRSDTSGTTEGWSEAAHKRPLLNADEIGRLLARVDDCRRPGYPGVVLALVPGEHPLLARRVNYFESPRFLGCFDPHPNFPPPPTLAELAAGPPERPALPPPRPAWGERLQNAEEAATALIGLAVIMTGLVALGWGGYWLYGHRSSVVSALTAHSGVGQGTPVAGQRSPPAAKPEKAARSPASPTPAKPQAATETAMTTPAGSSSAGAPASSAQSQSAGAAPAAFTPAVNAQSLTPAYKEGVADWDALQAWFHTQTGDRLAGANYYAANRHDPAHPADCSAGAEDYGRTATAGAAEAFGAGCLAAKRRLDPIDARRKDPDYRAGFKAEAKRAPAGSASPVAAVSSPKTKAPPPSPQSPAANTAPAAPAPDRESVAYKKGVADWDRFLSWSRSRTALGRAGIAYFLWVHARTGAHFANCAVVSKKYRPFEGIAKASRGDINNINLPMDFSGDCASAGIKLRAIELQRKNDPDYRAGSLAAEKRFPVQKEVSDAAAAEAEAAAAASEARTEGRIERPSPYIARTDSAGFKAGAAEWDRFYAWYRGLRRPLQVGAAYYVRTVRTTTGLINCSLAARNYGREANNFGPTLEFMTGCMEAQSRLSALAPHSKDADYRSGVQAEERRRPID